MLNVRTTEEFDKWLHKLKDLQIKTRIVRQLARKWREGRSNEDQRF